MVAHHHALALVVEPAKVGEHMGFRGGDLDRLCCAEDLTERATDPFGGGATGGAIALNAMAGRTRRQNDGGQRQQRKERNAGVDADHQQGRGDSKDQDRDLIHRPADRIFDPFGIIAEGVEHFAHGPR